VCNKRNFGLRLEQISKIGEERPRDGPPQARLVGNNRRFDGIERLEALDLIRARHLRRLDLDLLRARLHALARKVRMKGIYLF